MADELREGFRASGYHVVGNFNVMIGNDATPHEPVTVADLIARLLQLPQDLPVYVPGRHAMQRWAYPDPQVTSVSSDTVRWGEADGNDAHTAVVL